METTPKPDELTQGIGRVLLTEAEIQQRVRELGAQISLD